ncbi:MAG: hypothetical protein ABIK92_16785 [Pseudomonadota bacterium]
MEQETAGFAAFIPLILMTLPIIIFNIFLSKRKGRRPFLYGILSIIPVVGFYLALYLASLTDKTISEKIDKIISLLESK